MAPRWLLVLALLTAACRKPPAPTPSSPFVDAKLCAACHAEIAKSYSQTGMARSFYRATSPRMQLENWSKGNRFYHAPSGRHYAMESRDGKYYLRRWQTGYRGEEDNVLEAEIHYVMGSGNAARSYLHRTPQGRLAELPVAWYAANGGFFAMSPGYNRPDHQGFRRKISTDCMFCHNAYPSSRDVLPATEPTFDDPLPEGIDCQRCHGPGRAHIDAASVPNAKKETVRAAIINPARLPRERSLEVCMQCHLETTSFPLPNSLVRFGRGAFTYEAGKPLAGFMLHFDHAPGTGREGKFEIVSSAYRLRQSACYQKSGTLQCTTCHDPHRPARADNARYTKACRQCHAQVASPSHPQGDDCAACHMPKRRTEDVVHAAVTDHKIQRRPELANPLAPIAERHERPGEAYRGEVVLYHPAPPPSGQDELYLALAQVVQRSNLKAGIPRLAAAIRKHATKEPRFVFGLAQAYAVDGRHELAIATYRRALDLDPSFVPAMRNLGEILHATGKPGEAITVLERARALAPENSSVEHILGQAYRDAGRLDAAVNALRHAIQLDPDFAEAHNSLGLVRIEKGDAAGAVTALRDALRHRPDYPEAHSNLASAYAASGNLPQAIHHHQAAIRLAPGSPSTHFNYAATLMASQSFDQAEKEMEATIRLQPNHPEALEALGSLSAARGLWHIAIPQYRKALAAKPDFDRAHLGLGSALAARGNTAEARQHLQKAAQSHNPAIQREAREVLSLLDGAGRR